MVYESGSDVKVEHNSHFVLVDPPVTVKQPESDISILISSPLIPVLTDHSTNALGESAPDTYSRIDSVPSVSMVNLGTDCPASSPITVSLLHP